MKLTEAQVDALRWIDRFPVTSAAWLTNGKVSKRGPETWNQMKLAGPRGSIIIAVDDWDVILPLHDVCPDINAPSPYVLNAAGRATLAEAAA